jgi:hypothetical protein
MTPWIPISPRCWPISNASTESHIAMPYTNIMELFGRISLGDITAYVASRGWEVEEDSDETVRFRGPIGVGGDPGEIWTWRPESHPKFRRRVPDVLFSLAVHEGRDALDIANELIGMGRRATNAKAGLLAGHSPQPAAVGETLASAMLPGAAGALVPSTPRPWTFTHRGADTLLVQLLPAGGTHSLEPGERLVIEREPATEPSSSAPVDLEWAESVLRIQRPADDLVTRIAQTVAYDAQAVRPTPRRILAEELGVLPSENGSDRTAEYLERLAETMQRVEFELDFAGPVDDRVRQAYRRQTALVVASLARLLPTTTWARRVLWRIAMRMLASAELALELNASSVDELYITAASDSEASPVRTLEWLVARTVTTYRT